MNEVNQILVLLLHSHCRNKWSGLIRHRHIFLLSRGLIITIVIILREIMVQRHSAFLHASRNGLVDLGPLAHLQKLIPLESLVGILAPETPEVVARNGVDDGVVLVAADVAVEV